MRYRGGGQAVRPGAIWERYLGSALPPGSYTVSVHIRRGPLLAQRSFEVLPEDLSTMEPAERLRLLPQYFDLLDEPEHLGDQGTPTAQLTGTSSHSTRDNTATTTTTTGTATSTTTSTNREPKMPRRETVTARQAPEPGKLKPVGSSGSVFRPGAKDREWLRKDPPLDTAGDGNSRIAKLGCLHVCLQLLSPTTQQQDVQRAAARRSRVAQTRLRSLRSRKRGGCWNVTGMERSSAGPQL